MHYLYVNKSELMHYGVKGMHWGIRKAVKSVGERRRTKKLEKENKKKQKIENRINPLIKEGSRLYDEYWDIKRKMNPTINSYSNKTLKDMEVLISVYQYQTQQLINKASKKYNVILDAETQSVRLENKKKGKNKN